MEENNELKTDELVDNSTEENISEATQDVVNNDNENSVDEIRCLNCGNLLSESDEFCPKCGTKKGERKVIFCKIVILKFRLDKNFAQNVEKKLILRQKNMLIQ